MVPVMTEHEPISARWLWSQHNEHRIPLPKLLLLGLYQISQNDFRAAMYVNALALSGLTAALIIGAKQLRGSTSYNDAYFPLALLHWGHSGNLLSGFQIQLVVSVVLAVTLLLIMVRRRTACLGPRTTIVGGL
jgi:hypothetical protein